MQGRLRAGTSVALGLEPFAVVCGSVHGAVTQTPRDMAWDEQLASWETQLGDQEASSKWT